MFAVAKMDTRIGEFTGFHCRVGSMSQKADHKIGSRRQPYRDLPANPLRLTRMRDCGRARIQCALASYKRAQPTRH